MALTRTPEPEKLLRGGLDEVDDAGLGRRVCGAPSARAQAGDAGRADDRPAAALRDERRRIFDGEERADEVDSQDLGPVLRRSARRSWRSRPRCRHWRRRCRGRRARARHVSISALHVPFAAGVDAHVRAFADVRANDCRAFAAEQLDGRLADARCGAGDDRDLARKSSHGGAHSHWTRLLIGARHGFQPWRRRDRMARPRPRFHGRARPAAHRRL